MKVQSLQRRVELPHLERKAGDPVPESGQILPQETQSGSERVRESGSQGDRETGRQGVRESREGVRERGSENGSGQGVAERGSEEGRE